jgi:hypothetical protein
MLDQYKVAPRRLKYFSRPPWRSYHFLLITFFLLMVTSFPIVIIVLARLSPKVSVILPMFAPVVAMVVLWVRVWRAHSDVYEAVHHMTVEERSKDARIAVPLDALAYMLYAGFGLALLAVCLAYAATEDFVKASLHR